MTVPVITSFYSCVLVLLLAWGHWRAWNFAKNLRVPWMHRPEVNGDSLCAGSSVGKMVWAICPWIDHHVVGHPRARTDQCVACVEVTGQQRAEPHQFLKCFQLSVWIAAWRMPSRSLNRNGVEDAEVVIVRGMSADLSPATTIATGAPPNRRLSRSASDLSSSSLGSVSCMHGLSGFRRANAARRITMTVVAFMAHNIYYDKL